MSPESHNYSDLSERKWTIFWFIWAPGTWKTTAMNIVENEENREEVGRDTWFGTPSFDVVRKATSRENRWSDDRLKLSWIPETDITENPEKYIWQYRLTNNNAVYAYPIDELEKDADVLVWEPSMHHLSTMKEALKDRLITVFIAADTEYRKVRMNWRWTEEESQVNKRVLEWDVQIYIASKISWEDWKILEWLIDSKLKEILDNIYTNWLNETNSLSLKDYIYSLVWDENFADKSAKEYANMILEDTKSKNKKLFDHIIVRTLEKDKSEEGDFLRHGQFRDEVISIVKQHLKK